MYFVRRLCASAAVLAAVLASAAVPSSAHAAVTPAPSSAAAHDEAPLPRTADVPVAGASARAAAAAGVVGQATRYVNSSGRTVLRVDDGFDPDQYLSHSTMSFSFDGDQDYGPELDVLEGGAGESLVRDVV